MKKYDAPDFEVVKIKDVVSVTESESGDPVGDLD